MICRFLTAFALSNTEVTEQFGHSVVASDMILKHFSPMHRSVLFLTSSVYLLFTRVSLLLRSITYKNPKERRMWLQIVHC